MKKFLAVLAAAALLVTGYGGSDSGAEKPAELHIAAAASLTDAMKEIGVAYGMENPGVKFTFNFSSSGALQQAIENGGATDLFFSAAQKQMDALESSGNLADGTRKNLLENIEHIALGEPKGVPVGQYSEKIFQQPWNFGRGEG